MAPSQPPRQPRLGWEHLPDGPEEGSAPEHSAGDSVRHTGPSESEPSGTHGGSHRFPGPAADPDDASASATPTPRVRVSDPSKVTRMGSGEPPVRPPAEPEDHGVIRFPETSYGRARRRRRLAVLGVLLALLVFVGVVFFSPLFETRSIEVKGARVSDPAAVEKALERYKGIPLTRLSKGEIEATVDDVPQVKSVDVVFDPPHGLVVQLHERVGVAAVADGDSWVLVDSQGKQLDTVPKAKRPDVPVVEGGRDVLSSESFTAIGDVLASLPSDVLGQLESAQAPGGSSVELTFEDSRKVVWGDASESELKAKVLAALVNSDETSAAREYDVSAPRHPVTK